MSNDNERPFWGKDEGLQKLVDALEGPDEPDASELREALKGLVERLDEIHADPAYKAVWTSYHVHGGRYEGPTYVEALSRAKAALADTQ